MGATSAEPALLAADREHLDAVDALDLSAVSQAPKFQALACRGFCSREVSVKDPQHRRAVARNPLES